MLIIGVDRRVPAAAAVADPPTPLRRRRALRATKERKATPRAAGVDAEPEKTSAA